MAKISTTHITGRNKNQATTITQAIPGTSQTKMRDNGFGWEADDITRLRRFLCLGVTSGTYYISEQKLTKENADNIIGLIKRDGLSVVNEVVRYATEGLAPKNDPLSFTLALCVAQGDEAARKAALDSLGKVCTIPTHLFAFVEYLYALRPGHSTPRSIRTAIAKWYNSYEPQKLAFHVTKYQNRNGWSHADVFRMAHVAPASPEINQICTWATWGFEKPGKNSLSKQLKIEDLDAPHMKAIKGFELAKKVETANEAIELITEYDLSFEHLPTELLKEKKIWKALVPNLGLTALMRNLNKLSAYDVITPNSDILADVRARLKDEQAIRKAKIHPFNALVALYTYSRGKGVRGSMEWKANQKIVDDLNDMYYTAFKNVEPTGKRIQVNIDVSGSMDGWDLLLGKGNAYASSVQNGLTARVGAAALAMLFVKTDKQVHTQAFCDHLVDLDLSPRMRLDDVIKKTSSLSFGATNIGLPIEEARRKKIPVDLFITITDCEANCGIHPSEALKKYRREMGINAKNAVVALTADKYTIADPNDRGQMDFVGFDAGLGRMVSDFAMDRF